jgi:hypothetical protein
MNWLQPGPTNKLTASSDCSSDGTSRKRGLELEQEKRTNSEVPGGKRSHRLCIRRPMWSVDDNVVTKGMTDTNLGQVMACDAKTVYLELQSHGKS